MDLKLGHYLLSHVILHNDVDSFKSIMRSELVEEELALYDFVSRHYTVFRQLPDMDTVIDDCGEPITDDIIQPAAYYLEKISNRFVNLATADFVSGINSANIEGAEAVKQFISDNSSSIITSGYDHDLISASRLTSELIKENQQFRDGKEKNVILTGYDALDSDLLGLDPESGDMLIIAGRLKMGKTYIALNMMANMLLNGMKGLIVTMEMSPKALNTRLVSIISGVNPKAFKKGGLDDRSTKRLAQAEEMINDMKMVEYLGGNFKKTPEDIGRAMARTGAQVALLDGVYLIDSNGTSRDSKTERLGNVINEIKAISVDNGCVTIPTVQMNRNAAGSSKGKKIIEHESVSVENIAGSDSYGQVASGLIGIGGVQGDSKKRRLTMMASRDAVGEYDHIVNFGFSPPDYNEFCSAKEYEARLARESADAEAEMSGHYNL